MPGKAILFGCRGMCARRHVLEGMPIESRCLCCCERFGHLSLLAADKGLPRKHSSVQLKIVDEIACSHRFPVDWAVKTRLASFFEQ